MGNHRIGRPELKSVMRLSDDKKFVITEIIITEQRPVEYYQKELLAEIGRPAARKLGK